MFFLHSLFFVRYLIMSAKDEIDDCDIIKQGLMVKRSQNKKRFMPINYKQRWFVLTTKNLIYYESESEVSMTNFNLKLFYEINLVWIHVILSLH